jgi:hypothetical protein
MIWVKCIGIDDKGRVKLSRKAALKERAEKETGQAAELIQINGGNGDNAESDRAALNPDRRPAGFKGVDCSLNKFFAARHFMSARLWR